ncbi:hypothetical protein PSSHI_06670 [Photobacterium sp. R1]
MGGVIRAINSNGSTLHKDLNRLLDMDVNRNATLEQQLALANRYHETLQKSHTQLEHMANFSEEELSVLKGMQGQFLTHFDEQYSQMGGISGKLADLNQDINSNLDENNQQLLSKQDELIAAVQESQTDNDETNQKLDAINDNIDTSNEKLAEINQTILDGQTKDDEQHSELLGKLDELKDGQTLTGEKLDGIGESLDHLADNSDALANLNTSGAGTVSCFQSNTCTGYYHSKYPNGMGGIMDNYMKDMMSGERFKFLNQFQVGTDGAQGPDTGLSFDFGAMGNFGRFDLDIGYGVWGFIRACILFSAALLCRRLVFGG